MPLLSLGLPEVNNPLQRRFSSQRSHSVAYPFFQSDMDRAANSRTGAATTQSGRL
jgi:hypothetical protein